MHAGRISSGISSAFSLLLSRLLRFLLHSPCKACRARIGLCRLGARGNVIHFGHGQLAHGVFRVFWVAAGEMDILDMAHFEEKMVRWREAIVCCGGLSGEECDAMEVADCGWQ